MRLSDRGIKLFSHLNPEQYKREFVATAIPSGISDLDEILHDNVCKTTVGLNFMRETARRDERSAPYTFEENLSYGAHFLL